MLKEALFYRFIVRTYILLWPKLLHQQQCIIEHDRLHTHSIFINRNTQHENVIQYLLDFIFDISDLKFCAYMHKTSSLTQGKSPRMSCGGNLSGGENQQRTTKPCDGNQCTMMMQAVNCDGLGGWVWEIINRGRFDLVLVWGERVYVA